MGVPKRLTEMQRKFAEILVFGDKDGRAVTKTEKLEDLSEQELENKMKQILEDYAPLLNAKTVEGESEVISSESSLPTDEESLSDPQS